MRNYRRYVRDDRDTYYDIEEILEGEIQNIKDDMEYLANYDNDTIFKSKEVGKEYLLERMDASIIHFEYLKQLIKKL